MKQNVIDILAKIEEARDLKRRTLPANRYMAQAVKVSFLTSRHELDLYSSALQQAEEWSKKAI